MPPALSLGLGLPEYRGVWGGFVPVYLLRDEFTTNVAAPVPSPRNCEPGPGQLTLSQVAGQFSIVGGLLTVAVGSNFEPRAASANFARVVGRTTLCRVGLPVAGVISRFGWDNGGNLVETHGFLITAGGDLGARIGGLGLSQGITTPSGFEYECAFVLRSSGAFYLIKGGAITNWKLVWVDAGVNSTPVASKATVSTGTGAGGGGTFDGMRAIDLPAPWNTDFGIATDRKAGAVANGTTFNHAANGLIEWTETTVPPGSNTSIRFRQQDALNYWFIQITTTGAMFLTEVAAGVTTNRANGGAGGVASGHRCVVIFDGAQIRGVSNNVLQFNYSLAANFQTATAGQMETAGSGGAVSDLVSWPRNIDLPAV
jgi:hypothetical protein